MNKQLSTEQIQINEFIEHLRTRKERMKNSILFINNEITDIDIEIRRLRQLFPTLAPIVEKPKRITKHKETDEEKLERLTKELDALKAGMRK